MREHKHLYHDKLNELDRCIHRRLKQLQKAKEDAERRASSLEKELDDLRVEYNALLSRATQGDDTQRRKLQQLQKQLQASRDDIEQREKDLLQREDALRKSVGRHREASQELLRQQRLMQEERDRLQRDRDALDTAMLPSQSAMNGAIEKAKLIEESAEKRLKEAENLFAHAEQKTNYVEIYIAAVWEAVDIINEELRHREAIRAEEGNWRIGVIDARLAHAKRFERALLDMEREHNEEMEHSARRFRAALEKKQALIEQRFAEVSEAQHQLEMKRSQLENMRRRLQSEKQKQTMDVEDDDFATIALHARLKRVTEMVHARRASASPPLRSTSLGPADSHGRVCAASSSKAESSAEIDETADGHRRQPQSSSVHNTSSSTSGVQRSPVVVRSPFSSKGRPPPEHPPPAEESLDSTRKALHY
jgi:chromosome segregation ATPase